MLWHIVDPTYADSFRQDTSENSIPDGPCCIGQGGKNESCSSHVGYTVVGLCATRLSPGDTHSHLLKLKGRIFFKISRCIDSHLLISSLPASLSPGRLRKYFSI